MPRTASTTARKSTPPFAARFYRCGRADLEECLLLQQRLAYDALTHIRMENSHFRRDIGSKGLRTCWACSR